MKVLYLFNGKRKTAYEKVKTGENHGDGFWGMVRLPHYGIEAEYVELEDYLPEGFARIIRKYVNVYFIHIFFFWKIFFYDVVFTSSAFGTQLLYAFLHIQKPLWVMHDFSITSLVGDEKTLKQKLFTFMVRKSQAVVTLSKREKDLLVQKFPHLSGRVEFIPFGVDTEFFSPREVIEKTKPYIMAVGFDPDRDWKTVIEATKDISIRVILATRPERVSHLAPLPPHVEVRQFELKDLIQTYSGAEAIIVPLDTTGGVNDAMGCSTLYEAMSMAKPVIVTETLTTASYITDKENGFLVKEKDVQSMRDAITYVLEHREESKQIGQNARQYVIEHLDAEKKAKELADFFKRVTSQA